MNDYVVASGMSVRDFNRVWRRLGGQIQQIRRTGEIRYQHPSVRSTTRASYRRRHASLKLISVARRLLKSRDRQRRGATKARAALNAVVKHNNVERTNLP